MSSSTFATSYIWSLPAGVVAQGSTTGVCITVRFTSRFNGGFICARAVTPCGTTPPACKNITRISQAPVTPGIITGPSSLCSNQTATYSIAPVPTATSYLWSEDNLIILSGQGTTSVTVQAEPGFGSGKIKVRAVNCRDRSGERSKNISRNPSTPGTISGPATLCPNQVATYTIAAVQNASSYVWGEDNLIILSGQGTTSVTVKAEPNFNGGKIKVRALSSCGGQSSEKSMDISKSTGC